MRRVLLVGPMLLLTFGAGADPAVNITRMTCDRVQAAVKANGSAILHYRSKKNLPMYGRYVSDGSFCDSRQTIAFASVPTVDRKNCPVKKCESIY